MAYSTTTRAVLRTRCRERLLNTFWSNDEINRYIVEGLRVWNVLTGYQRNIYSSVSLSADSTGAGYAISAINSQAMILLRLELSAGTHLDPAQLADLNNLSPTWLSTTSVSPSNWIQIGLNRFYVYPRPSGTVSGNTMYMVDQFAVPSSDSDYIQIGEEDMSAIIDYVEFASSLKEGGKETQDAVLSLKSFLAQASKYNSKIQNTSLYKKVMGVPFQKQQRPTDLAQQYVR